MQVVHARNVNGAYYEGMRLLRHLGQPSPSRAGGVLVVPTPVMTVYERPQERVLLDPGRDANPFFHLFEALWMLAGRSDARFLDRFVSDFSQRFAEPDGRQWGAYGRRWRDHFSDDNADGENDHVDQLEEVVGRLRRDPLDRRSVIAMWDPQHDLWGPDRAEPEEEPRDVPCNTHIYLRVRPNKVEDQGKEALVLDLTVMCRSNDAVWGAYGANAVHFSFLQEYLAGRIGVDVGAMYQLSNNFHAYTGLLDRLPEPAPVRDYPGTLAIGSEDWDWWNADLRALMSWVDSPAPVFRYPEFKNTWFAGVPMPMLLAHSSFKLGDHDAALDHAAHIAAPDWRLAVVEWLNRRKR